MSYKLARQILNYELQQFSITNNIPVAWENIPFDKDINDEFLQVYFLTSEPDENFLTNGNRIKGVLQININVVIEQGTGRIQDLIDLLENHFQDAKFNNDALNYTISIDDIWLQNQTEKVRNNKFVEILNISWQSWR